MKKILIGLFCILLLSGCGSNESDKNIEILLSTTSSNNGAINELQYLYKDLETRIGKLENKKLEANPLEVNPLEEKSMKFYTGKIGDKAVAVNRAGGQYVHCISRQYKCCFFYDKITVTSMQTEGGNIDIVNVNGYSSDNVFDNLEEAKRQAKEYFDHGIFDRFGK